MSLANTTPSEPVNWRDSSDKGSTSRQATLEAVADALSRLRYGAVHLTVHDGKVVQLDVTERQRFT